MPGNATNESQTFTWNHNQNSNDFYYLVHVKIGSCPSQCLSYTERHPPHLVNRCQCRFRLIGSYVSRNSIVRFTRQPYFISSNEAVQHNIRRYGVCQMAWSNQCKSTRRKQLPESYHTMMVHYTVLHLKKYPKIHLHWDNCFHILFIQTTLSEISVSYDDRNCFDLLLKLNSTK